MIDRVRPNTRRLGGEQIVELGPRPDSSRRMRIDTHIHRESVGHVKLTPCFEVAV